MAKEEPPTFILPKKRNGKKQSSITGHVDHIITVQGSADEVPVKFKNGLSPVTEHDANIIHTSVEALKNLKMNLPVINDDEDMNDANTEDTEKHHIQKNGYQAVSTNTSREIIDLSPIYENSSDACSSHGDLRENDNEMQKSCKTLNTETNESLLATPNSLSQAQSETSIEMGNLSDSLKSAKKKKKVNIAPGNLADNSENTDADITTMRMESEDSISADCSLTDNSKESYLTMTGTIKRGKKKGMSVDVKLNISREELEIIEAAIIAEEYDKMNISKCSLYHGAHIFIFSLLCIPFVAIISGAHSFYTGTLSWYNVFCHVVDNVAWPMKIVLIPIVVIVYPFLIIIFTVGLGLYAGIVQLTFSGSNWWKGVSDFEKGFYGWLCNAIGLSECSPYEVVVLMDVKST